MVPDSAMMLLLWLFLRGFVAGIYKVLLRVASFRYGSYLFWLDFVLWACVCVCVCEVSRRPSVSLIFDQCR